MHPNVLLSPIYPTKYNLKPIGLLREEAVPFSKLLELNVSFFVSTKVMFLDMFLNFGNFEPRYFYKRGSYKKECAKHQALAKTFVEPAASFDSFYRQKLIIIDSKLLLSMVVSIKCQITKAHASFHNNSTYFWSEAERFFNV